MATGNIHVFGQGLADLNNKLIDWDTDDIRLAICTTAVVPTITTVAPHFGGTGTTNFATTQVATGGTSYTGPIALTRTQANVAGVQTLRADIVTLPIDAAGFTNGAWGIFYNNSDANKRAFAYIELSATGVLSLVAGQVVIDWSGVNNDLITFTPA